MSSEANNFTADQFAKQTCTQAALAIYYSYKLSLVPPYPLRR